MSPEILSIKNNKNNNKLAFFLQYPTPGLLLFGFSNLFLFPIEYFAPCFEFSIL